MAVVVRVRKVDWWGDWMARARKEVAMDRWRALEPTARSGLLFVLLLSIALVAWVAGSAWVAVPSAIGVLGTAASAAGSDSREPGDWRRPGS
jgi:hypothetical protein